MDKESQALDDAYYADRHWSYSSLKHLAGDFPDWPKALESLFGLNKASASMALGTATHSLILDPEPKITSAEALGFDSFRTKDAKAARDERLNAGWTVLSNANYAAARKMADAVLSHPMVKRFDLFGGVHEEGHELDAQGMAIRFKPDSYTLESPIGPFVVDLKTTQDTVLYGGFTKAAKDYRYDVQAALYSSSLRSAYGLDVMPRFFFVAVDGNGVVGCFEASPPSAFWDSGAAAIAQAVGRVVERGWEDPKSIPEHEYEDLIDEREKADSGHVAAFRELAESNFIQL